MLDADIRGHVDGLRVLVEVIRSNCDAHAKAPLLVNVAELQATATTICVVLANDPKSFHPAINAAQLLETSGTHIHDEAAEDEPDWQALDAAVFFAETFIEQLVDCIEVAGGRPPYPSISEVPRDITRHPMVDIPTQPLPLAILNSALVPGSYYQYGQRREGGMDPEEALEQVLALILPPDELDSVLQFFTGTMDAELSHIKNLHGSSVKEGTITFLEREWHDLQMVPGWPG